LGTIAKVVANGEDIYRGKLRFAEALGRVNKFYHPYHAALRRLIDQTRQRFGYCLLLDCHSMPSSGNPPEAASPRAKVDFVLGDCYGSACSPVLMETAERTLRAQGYMVIRNTPYAGGFTTRHYGRPRLGIQALQIEINRALYMDERSISRKPYIGELAEHMEDLVRVLSRVRVPLPD
jgi:N-formylglutamate amidohydrolase